MMLFSRQKTLLPLIFLLVIPVIILLTHWQWQPESLNQTSYFLFLLTETAGNPFAVVTCLIFTIFFIFNLKKKTKPNIVKLAFILVLAILLSQSIKSVIKDEFKESRPYVQWIVKQSNNSMRLPLEADKFYAVSKKERKAIISEQVESSKTIPHWLVKHWQAETSYSFPSGHTIFSATWVFLAFLFLKNRRILTGISLIWAIGIEISRVFLGMHHPIDLICAVILAWIIAQFCSFLAKKCHLIE